MTQQTFCRNGRAKLRISEIEKLIRVHRIIVPAPSRRTLTNMCEKGVFETVGDAPTDFGWLVFEDSFWEWVKKLEG